MDDIVDHAHDGIAQGIGCQDLAALAVEDFTLLVHDIVIFQDVLTDFKVVAFDFLLGLFNGPGDHLGRNRFVFIHAQLIHELGNIVRAEDTHEVVFQGQEEPGSP